MKPFNAAIPFQIYLLILSITFLTSCHGQDNENTRKTLKTISNSLQKNTTEIDPLFYIDGQLCQHLRKIYQAKNGDFWFGTNVYGLMHYNGDTLKYYDETNGFHGGRVTGILEDSIGNIWISSYHGLSKYDGKSFKNFSEDYDLKDHEAWSLIMDKKGLFWMGTSEGVYQFDGEKFTAFPIPKATVKDTTSIVSYNRVSCILEDKNGTLWFGTDGFGICKYDGKSFSQVTTDDGLCDNNVGSMLEDKNGNIWIGTMYGGLSLFDGKSFTNFTKDGIINGVEVGALYKDKSGDIWFAAENHGVYRYNAGLNDEVGQGKSFTNYYKKENLNTNGVLAIFEDQQGKFWFGGWGGLFCFNGESFYSVTKDGPWD